MIARELFTFSPPREDNNPSVGSLASAARLTLSPLFPSHLHHILLEKSIKFMVLQDISETLDNWTLKLN